MSSNIRLMVRNDLPPVQSLVKELGYSLSASEAEERFLKLMNNSHHAFFVYQGESSIVGFMHLEKINSFLYSPKIEIRALVIDEKYQGQGLGKTFIDESKRWAKSNDIHTLFLSCNIIRESAHHFYERRGFKKIKSSYFFEMSF